MKLAVSQVDPSFDKNDPKCAKAFQKEVERKDKLIALFEKLEAQTKELFKHNKRQSGDRVINDLVFVKAITDASVQLERENGEVLVKVLINKEIASLLKVDDHLYVTAESRRGQWHIYFVASIGSYLTPEMH